MAISQGSYSRALPLLLWETIHLYTKTASQEFIEK